MRSLHPGFQFLIGRLDTTGSSFFFLLLASFQFLIGRLDTAFSLEDVRDAVAFQFLIGRLDTKRGSLTLPWNMSFNSS